MFCKNCGRELEDGAKICKNCGTAVAEDETFLTVWGGRQTMRRYIREFPTEVTIKKTEGNGFQIHAETIFKSGKDLESVIKEDGSKDYEWVRKIKKSRKADFFSGDIAAIEFKSRPVIFPLDIFLMALVALLIPVSYGAALAAVAAYFQMTLCKNLALKMKDGSMIRIPLKQNADAAEFLTAIGFEAAGRQAEARRCTESGWRAKKFLVNCLVFLLAGAVTTAGVQSWLLNKGSSKTASNRRRDEDARERTHKEEIEENAEEQAKREGALKAIEEKTEEHQAPIVFLNNTGDDIYALYLSSAETDDWEEDVLGDDVWEAGSRRTVNLYYSGGETMYDFAIVDITGEQIEFLDAIDISQYGEDGATVILNIDGTADIKPGTGEFNSLAEPLVSEAHWKESYRKILAEYRRKADEDEYYSTFVSVSYALYDMNSDGVPELIVIEDPESSREHYNSIYSFDGMDLFSLENRTYGREIAGDENGGVNFGYIMGDSQGEAFVTNVQLVDCQFLEEERINGIGYSEEDYERHMGSIDIPTYSVGDESPLL